MRSQYGPTVQTGQAESVDRTPKDEGGRMKDGQTVQTGQAESDEQDYTSVARTDELPRRSI
jgi:hypothetical protein